MLDLKKLLERLLQHDVEFILVGGFAAVVHGSSSLTQDLDVCCSFEDENIQKLLVALNPVHPCARAGKGWIKLHEIKNLSRYNTLNLKTDEGPLDLLGQVTGVGTYDDVRKHVTLVDLFGYSCRVLDLDSLIRSKEAMDREKDKQTVLQLKAIREKLTGK